MAYIDKTILKEFAADDTDSSQQKVWDMLPEGVSRLFDRACEVPDGFFNKAGDADTVKTFRSNGTEYLALPPYLSETISAISVDTEDLVLGDDTVYFEKDGWLLFASAPAKNVVIQVIAIWGFAAVPADIVQACIEQALFMWRRKDMAFAELSGVPTAAVVAEYSPTFKAVSDKYRGLYSENSYFA